MKAKKSLWCRIFGCHVPTGYGEYFRVELGAVDGINRHHARIVGRCDNCDSPVTMGSFHTHADGHLYGSKERFEKKVNRNAKSNYRHQIDGRILFIEDLDHGGKSVTDNIENVLAEISEQLGTSISNFDVIYRDSENKIDGVHTCDGKFTGFYFIQETDYYKAKLKVKPRVEKV